MEEPNTPILPAPTPVNAITMQMQFQVEVIRRLDEILAVLNSIASKIQTTQSTHS
jgi:hypothetical protein